MQQHFYFAKSHYTLMKQQLLNSFTLNFYIRFREKKRPTIANKNYDTKPE